MRYSKSTYAHHGSQPLPSRATRKINFRSRVSGRASLVRVRRYDGQLVHLLAESIGEVRCVNLLMARRDIVDIWDQPSPVRFQRANGKMAQHTFDYLVHLASGRKIAVAVKPYDRVRKTGFVDELARISEAMPVNVADKVVLLTERDFPRYQAVNAARLCEFVKFPDAEADDAIQNAVSCISGRIKLGHLVRMTGLGSRAYRAAHQALYDGKLVPANWGIIGSEMVISGGATQ